MTRIPNHKIDQAVTLLHPFENYNGTITAEIVNAGNSQLYDVVHWRTRILTFDLNTSEIVALHAGYISQTTSTLLGRLLRNLPEHSVRHYLANAPLDQEDRRRLRRMARL
jgi:hypothetical protein